MEFFLLALAYGALCVAWRAGEALPQSAQALLLYGYFGLAAFMLFADVFWPVAFGAVPNVQAAAGSVIVGLLFSLAIPTTYSDRSWPGRVGGNISAQQAETVRRFVAGPALLGHAVIMIIIAAYRP